jgi:uncharacterized LabA/DUF88 family protein
MKRLIVMIDGGHLRAQSRRDSIDYNPDFIEDFVHVLPQKDEELLRAFYYDCRPYQGETTLPVSGEKYQFKSGGGWLDELASREYLLVRTGMLKFRGWKPKAQQVPEGPLTDDDFRPDFEQRGVELMLGLDLVRLAQNRAADRIMLISGDSDLIPAMAQVRETGTQLLGADFPSGQLHGEILSHFDVIRDVKWPQGAAGSAQFRRQQADA